MDILNCGSLNIDYVYQVPHRVQGGETIHCTSFQVLAGGKGANQSVAMARAGAKVAHFGKVGKEGQWLVKKMQENGIDVQSILTSEEATGHAIIQVEPDGQNSIIVYPGCNRQIQKQEIDPVIERFSLASTLVLQNEINEIPYFIKKAKERGLKVCFNGAPFGKEIFDYPLESVDVLMVNKTEGQGLTGKESDHAILSELAKQLPQAEIILTLGTAGVLYHSPQNEIQIPAFSVKAVDTTGAGDTFVGYYIAGRSKGYSVENALKLAGKAAAVCVTRKGAMDSIPKIEEMESIIK